MPETFLDRIIGFKEGDIYVAVSLEFDLVAEGKTMSKAFSSVQDATIGYLSVALGEGLSVDQIYRPAPAKYQKIYDEIRSEEMRTQKGVLLRKERAISKNDTQTLTHFIPTSLFAHA